MNDIQHFCSAHRISLEQASTGAATGTGTDKGSTSKAEKQHTAVNSTPVLFTNICSLLTFVIQNKSESHADKAIAVPQVA